MRVQLAQCPMLVPGRGRTEIQFCLTLCAKERVKMKE